MADEMLPHLQGYIDDLGVPDTLEKAIAERNAWVESAAMFSRNEDYYRGLLDQIAAHIGPEARKADNGDDMHSVVRARLPELVASRLATDAEVLRGAARAIALVRRIAAQESWQSHYGKRWEDEAAEIVAALSPTIDSADRFAGVGKAIGIDSANDHIADAGKLIGIDSADGGHAA